jgi:hypothetical protein
VSPLLFIRALYYRLIEPWPKIRAYYFLICLPPRYSMHDTSRRKSFQSAVIPSLLSDLGQDAVPGAANGVCVQVVARCPL